MAMALRWWQWVAHEKGIASGQGQQLLQCNLPIWNKECTRTRLCKEFLNVADTDPNWGSSRSGTKTPPATHLLPDRCCISEPKVWWPFLRSMGTHLIMLSHQSVLWTSCIIKSDVKNNIRVLPSRHFYSKKQTCNVDTGLQSKML